VAENLKKTLSSPKDLHFKEELQKTRSIDELQTWQEDFKKVGLPLEEPLQLERVIAMAMSFPI